MKKTYNVLFRLDKVAFFEQGAKSLKIVTPDLKPYKEIKDLPAPLMACQYIPNYRIIAISFRDGGGVMLARKLFFLL